MSGMSINSVLNQPSINISGYKCFGWVLCMPLPPRSKVLLVSNNCGVCPELLSRLGHEVTVVSPKIENHNVNDLLNLPPDSEYKFGAIIVSGDFYDFYDFSELWNKNVHYSSKPFFEKLASLLANDGVIWLGIGSLRLISKLKGCYIVLSQLRHLLRSGLKFRELYELLPSYQRPFEIATLYEGIQEYALQIKGDDNYGQGIKGYLKQKLPKLFKVLFLCPALGVVLNRKHNLVHDCFISGLLKHVAVDGATIHRILFGNPDTLLLIFGTEEMSYVLKLPFNEISVKRCEANKRALEDIFGVGLYASITVPKFVESGSYCGFPYFVEEKIKGVAIDNKDYPIHSYVKRSAEYLLLFNKITVSISEITTVFLTATIDKYIDLLLPHGDELACQMLLWCRGYIYEKMLGQEVPLVYLHGDFKLENLLIDIEAGQVNGIIDWDLSSSSSFPLLDLFHLLAYEKWMLHSTTLESTIVSWLNGSWVQKDSSILNEHIKEIGLDRELLRPLIMIYLLHHLSERIDSSSKFSKNYIADILNIVLPVFSNEKI